MFSIDSLFWEFLLLFIFWKIGLNLGEVNQWVMLWNLTSCLFLIAYAFRIALAVFSFLVFETT